MSQRITPLLYLVTLVAGWISRHQLDVIESLREEAARCAGKWATGSSDSPILSGVGSPSVVSSSVASS